jgi:hypothetical protein
MKNKLCCKFCNKPLTITEYSIVCDNCGNSGIKVAYIFNSSRNLEELASYELFDLPNDTLLSIRFIDYDKKFFGELDLKTNSLSIFKFYHNFVSTIESDSDWTPERFKTRLPMIVTLQ